MDPLIETASAYDGWKKQIESAREEAHKKLAFLSQVEFNICELGKKLPNGINMYIWGNQVAITVKNREDLSICLSIGTVWKKQNSGGGINYRWTDPTGIDWSITAQADALPATCKVEKERILIPARPAYYEEHEKITCNFRPGVRSASQETQVADQPANRLAEDVPF